MEEFKNNIIAQINESQLPFEAKFYVFKDIFREMSDTYYKYIAEIEAQKQLPEQQEDKDGIQQCT